MSTPPAAVSIARLLDFQQERHQLQPPQDPATLQREIRHREVVRPGLALLGYRDPIPPASLWLLGPGELDLLETADSSVLQRFLQLEPAAVVVPDNGSLPTRIQNWLQEHGIPVLRSPLPALPLYRHLSDALAYLLAPTQVLHGTLVDVYGVGILITGPSGIGKSECALDLVQRGHILVGDDLIKLVHYPEGQLVGMSAAEDPVHRRYLEIRGVGLLDLGMLFGIHATRDTKRVEVHVAFVSYDQARDLDRLGLEVQHREFLGVRIPHYTLPVIPGKNLGVILEALALRYHLRQRGYFMAREFERRLSDHLKDLGQDPPP